MKKILQKWLSAPRNTWTPVL